MRKTIEQEILLILLEKEILEPKYLDQMNLHPVTKENKGMLISDIVKVSGCCYATAFKIVHNAEKNKMMKGYIPEDRAWKVYHLTPKGEKAAKYLRKVFGKEK